MVFLGFGIIKHLKYLKTISQSVTITDESLYNEKVFFSFNSQSEQVKLYGKKSINYLAC